MTRATGRALVAVLVVLAATALSCSGWLSRTEGLDRAAVPDAVRADYDLFALRCSKCHSLARPLSSGIDDDDYWVLYVERMRRQPGSGISQEDTVGILRFLHYFSQDLRKKKEHHDDAPPPAASSAPAPSAAPAPAPAPVPAAAGSAASARYAPRARGLL
jgi:hypothetical protein